MNTPEGIRTFLGDQLAANIISILLALITGVYVYLTHSIARANSKMAQQMLVQQENMLRPTIVANIEVTYQLLFVLKIRNVGASLAKNVTMHIDRDFFQHKQSDRNLRSLEVFSGKPFTLAQGDGLRFNLAMGFDVFGSDSNAELTPSEFTIKVCYTSATKSYEDNLIVDLKPFSRTNWQKSDIAAEIEALRKSIEKTLK